MVKLPMNKQLKFEYTKDLVLVSVIPLAIVLLVLAAPDRHAYRTVRVLLAGRWPMTSPVELVPNNVSRQWEEVGEEIWAVVNSEVLRVNEGDWSTERCRNDGAGKREVPEKTRRPTASSFTIPTCENPVTRPGIEPGSPWWEASVLTAQPPWPQWLESSRLQYRLTAFLERAVQVESEWEKSHEPSTSSIRRACGPGHPLEFPKLSKAGPSFNNTALWKQTDPFPHWRTRLSGHPPPPACRSEPSPARGIIFLLADHFRNVLSAGMERWGEREIPQKIRRQAASSDSIPTFQNSCTSLPHMVTYYGGWHTPSPEVFMVQCLDDKYTVRRAYCLRIGRVLTYNKLPRLPTSWRGFLVLWFSRSQLVYQLPAIESPSFIDWLKRVLVHVKCLHTNHVCTVWELRNPEWRGQMRKRHHHQPMKV
ncbi:hypothetical protein PR048_030833 [Dryococelus australis]|uniref:Uncharacterized protein n=1 Tax=Dryococelus australis TaxID=614101 RepID=A0ABQ9GCL0_9NEOP|nr:hypothetical protein PR048_030833 [Dryococelus australis]